MSRSQFSSDDSELASGERLQKVMAAAGVASRRVSEDMIAAGRVTVNGKVVTEPGRRIDPAKDKIVVDRSAVQLDATRRYVMLNKPVGIVSTLSDENGRPDLRQFTEQYEERLFNVGRLDVETSGLLVLTNDGELAHVLAHPSFGVTKTYIAKVKGVVTTSVLNELMTGVELDDGPIAADKATLVAGGAGLSRSSDSSLIEITLHSGRNRIVRRMLEAVGHPVIDLVRRSFGPLHLGTLKVGHMRSLTKVELGAILTISRDATADSTVDAAPITESPDAPVDEADVVELALADDEVEKDYYDEDDEEYDPATDARAERRRAAARDQAESTSRRAQVRREQEARRGQRDESPTRGGYQGNRHDGRSGDERPVRGYQGTNDDGRGREGRPARTGYHGSDERPARGGYQGRDDRGGSRGGYQGRNDDGRGESRGGYQGRNDDGRGRDDRPARGGYQGRDDRGGARPGYQGRNDDGRGRDDDLRAEAGATRHAVAGTEVQDTTRQVAHQFRDDEQTGRIQPPNRLS
jgi:pseudouridine synthase